MSQAKSLKKDLRTSVIAEILSQSESERRLLSERIQSRLSLFLQKKPGLWGAFKPLTSEPQINFDLLDSSIECCYPKVAGNKLEFYTQVNQWSRSSLQIEEPANGLRVELSDLVGIFVPALAFHANGQRLGRGLGFYDRILADFKGLKVGISFQFNILDSVPTESHDVGMDFIVTDEQVIQPPKGTFTGDQRSWN